MKIIEKKYHPVNLTNKTYRYGQGRIGIDKLFTSPTAIVMLKLKSETRPSDA